jgi:guanylate kinase
VILYGPPAVGKDTVTAAMSKLDPAYQLFPLLKVGTGKLAGYRQATADQLSASKLVTSWSRYGNTYAIDADGLSKALRTYSPVLHLGIPERVEAVLKHDQAVSWVVVELTYPRTVAEARLTQRNPHDVSERLRIFDRTPELTKPDLRLDTSTLTPEESARMILDQVHIKPRSTAV